MMLGKRSEGPLLEQRIDPTSIDAPPLPPPSTRPCGVIGPVRSAPNCLGSASKTLVVALDERQRRIEERVHTLLRDVAEDHDSMHKILAAALGLEPTTSDSAHRSAWGYQVKEERDRKVVGQGTHRASANGFSPVMGPLGSTTSQPAPSRASRASANGKVGAKPSLQRGDSSHGIMASMQSAVAGISDGIRAGLDTFADVKSSKISGHGETSPHWHKHGLFGVLEMRSHQFSTVESILDAACLGAAYRKSQVQSSLEQFMEVFMVTPAEKRGPLGRCCWNILSNRAYQCFCLIVIAMNFVFVGIASELDVTIGLHDTGIGLNEAVLVEVGRAVFSALFLVEINLRIGAEWGWLFHGERAMLNMLDISIVVCLLCFGAYRIYYALYGALYLRHDSTATATIAMLYATSALRVIHIVRVNSTQVRTLRVIVNSLLGGFKVLWWSIVFIMMIMYWFAVIIISSVSSHVSREIREGEQTELVDLYGTVFQTIHTLILATTGGDDWSALAQPLCDLSGVYYVVFPLFVAFMLLGVLNVVNGIFVDQAMRAAEDDKELAMQKDREQKQKIVDELKMIFEQADVDGSHTLTVDEFEDILEREEVKHNFRMLDLEGDEAHELFDLLSNQVDQNGNVHQTGVVSIDEFISGCLRLKGQAKSIHLEKLMYEQKISNIRLIEFMEETMRKLDGIITRVSMNGHKLSHSHSGMPLATQPGRHAAS